MTKLIKLKDNDLMQVGDIVKYVEYPEMVIVEGSAWIDCRVNELSGWPKKSLYFGVFRIEEEKEKKNMKEIKLKRLDILEKGDLIKDKDGNLSLIVDGLAGSQVDGICLTDKHYAAYRVSKEKVCEIELKGSDILEMGDMVRYTNENEMIIQGLAGRHVCDLCWYGEDNFIGVFRRTTRPVAQRVSSKRSLKNIQLQSGRLIDSIRFQRIGNSKFTQVGIVMEGEVYMGVAARMPNDQEYRALGRVVALRKLFKAWNIFTEGERREIWNIVYKYSPKMRDASISNPM